MNHTYTAMTARRAMNLGLRPTRPYGYVIRITPPIEHISTGEDIEGIGWVPHRGGPRKTLQHFHGWYKHKATAVERAASMNRP